MMTTINEVSLWYYLLAAIGVVCISAIFELMERAETWYSKAVLALFIVGIGVVFGNFIRLIVVR